MHKIHVNAAHIPLPNGIRDSLLVSSRHGPRGRSTTPIGRPVPANAAHLMSTIEGDLGAEEDPRLSIFRELYAKSEARLNALLGGEEEDNSIGATGADELQLRPVEAATVDAPASQLSAKPARHINEDDYDDSEDEDEDDSAFASPLKSKSTLPAINLAPSATGMVRGLSSHSTPASLKGTPSLAAGKTTEEARKKLEEDAKATEEAAKRSFHTLFYTLENDRDAMLEQKKLEESEHQVDVEMGATGAMSNAAAAGVTQQGTLSQTNLGASSLALKNLIRVIDSHRDRVPATDLELKTMFSDVRKGRGKWASEEKVGQEELYEAAETVLNSLRGSTEHSGPFLTRVNKKEAPDYSNSMTMNITNDTRADKCSRSHQNTHGSRHDDKEAQELSIQVQSRVCQRPQSDLGQLPEIQCEPRTPSSEEGSCHAQRNGEACTSHSKRCRKR